MGERGRFWIAGAGVPLWLGYPFVMLFGGMAKWQVRCGHRSFTGAFDDCFNDYIPVIEMLSFPLTLALFYPFLRFAFTLCAPSVGPHGRRWWLARRGSGADYFPSVQIMAGVAMIWAIVHLAGYPMTGRTAPFALYWVAWLIWLGVAIRLSWPTAERGE